MYLVASNACLVPKYGCPWNSSGRPKTQVVLGRLPSILAPANTDRTDAVGKPFATLVAHGQVPRIKSRTFGTITTALFQLALKKKT